MPSLERHREESRQRFGEEFANVHRWLDELFSIYGPRHRRFRHHMAGVEVVRRRWGNAAAQAARQHIVSDLREWGWQDADGLPIDQQDYVRIGLL